MIKLDYKNPSPLHEQIASGLKNLIMCSVLSPDEKLPSVRDLSVELTVNPNTVQHAYKTLENEGFIYSVRGKGNFVSKIPCADAKTLDALFIKFSRAVKEMKFYGKTKEEILSYAEKFYDEEEIL